MFLSSFLTVALLSVTSGHGLVALFVAIQLEDCVFVLGLYVLCADVHAHPDMNSYIEAWCMNIMLVPSPPTPKKEHYTCNFEILL